MSYVDVGVNIKADVLGAIRDIRAVRRELQGLRREQAQDISVQKALLKQTQEINKHLSHQSRAVRALTGDYLALRRVLLTFVTRTAITGFTALTAAINSLATSATAAVGSLANFGSAAVIGGLASLGAAATGVGLLAAALGGLGKAYTSVGQAHEKALGELTGPAREFYSQTKELTGAFREMRLLAQKGMFPGLVKAFESVSKLAPIFKQHIWDASLVLGYLADAAGEMISKRGPALDKILGRNTLTMRRLGDATINFTDGLITLVEAAGPLVGRMTRDIVTFSKGFKDLDGKKAGEFFRELRKSWQNWTATMGAVGEGLFEFWKAIQPVIHEVEDAIEGAAKGFRDWMSEDKNQNNVREFFQESLKPMGAFLELIGELGKVWVEFVETSGNKNAVRVFDGLREHVLPLLKDLFMYLGEKLFPKLLELGGAITDFLRDALPGFKTLISVLGPFLSIITDVLRYAGDLIQTFNDFGKVAGAIATLAVSAAIISSWKSLRQMISLTVLSMRGIAGTAPMPTAANFRQALPGRGFVGFVGGTARGIRSVPARLSDRRTQLASAFGGPNRRRFDAAFNSPGRTVMRDPETGRVITASSRFTANVPNAGLLRTPYPRNMSSIGRVGTNIDGYAAGVHRDRQGRWRDARGRFVANDVAPQTQRRGAGVSGARVRIPTTDLRIIQNQLDETTKKGVGSGLRNAFKGMRGGVAGFGLGPTIALTAGLAYGPGLVNNVKKNLSDRNEFNLPKTRGRGGLFGGAFPVGEFLLQTDRSSNDPVRKFGDSVEEMYKKAKKAGDSRALVKLAHQARDLGRVGGEGSDELKAFASKIDSELLGTTANAFKEFAQRGDTSINQVMDGLAVLQNEIGNKLPATSRVYKEAMGRSFTTAAAVIKAQVDAGVISARKGMRAYRRLLAQGLEEYGLSPKQAKEYANRRATGQSERNELGSVPAQDARGGFHIGRKGAAGRDNVPMMINGKPVMAAEGEYVGVFNRHQKPKLDAAVSHMGYSSLESFMASNNRPHYMASGGIVGLGRSLQKQGYMVSEHPAFGGVQGQHVAGSQHYAGNALDVNADHWPGGEKAALDKIASRLIKQGWHVLWQVADHFDHLHVDGIGGALDPFKLKRVTAKGDGKTMPIVQPLLDKARSAFTAVGQDILSNFSGDVPGGGGNMSNQMLAKSLLGTFGWGPEQWAPLQALGTGESNWDENALNKSSGAYGIGQFLGATKDAYAKFGATSNNPARQINAMLQYIKDRYGSPRAAYDFWLSNNPHWYSAGGLDALASAEPPPRGTTPPDVSGEDYVQPGRSKNGAKPKKKKKDEKDKKKPRFYGPKPAKGQGYGKADFKPKSKKPGRPRLRPKVRKLIKGPWQNHELSKVDPLTGERENLLLKFYNDWGKFGDRFNLDLEILLGNQGLSEEQAIVTNDAGQDVLNSEGMTVGGKFIPGISQALTEITDQLFLYRSKGFPGNTSDSGGILGVYETQDSYLKGLKPYVSAGIKERRARMRKLKKVFEANVKLREAQAEKMQKMQKKGLTWKEAIRANNKILKAWRRYKRDSDLKPGETREADSEIDRLVDENDWLRTSKPKTNAASSRGYAELLASYRQRGYENLRISGDSDNRKWDLSSFTAGSAAGRMADSLGFFTEIRDFTDQELPTLRSLIGSTKTTIQGLENSYTDWSGTQAPKPDTSGEDAIKDMLAEIGRQYLSWKHDTGNQAHILSGMQPLVNARMIGAFAHGGPIPETGMALLHRGEYVLPSPDGPFRTGMNSPTVNQEPPHIELVFRDRAGQLVELVDARINKRAAHVVSKQTGQQARILRAAPRG